MASYVSDDFDQPTVPNYASAWEDEGLDAAGIPPVSESRVDDDAQDNALKRDIRHSDEDNDGFSPPRRGSRSTPRTRFAQGLQRACDQALQHIKSQHVISTSEWAAPLTAAPSAISVMAILLKTADAKAAAGLKIPSNSLQILETQNVVGTLPSQYFHTNLQYCADVGRLAFLEAQNGMNRIQAIGRRMIGEEGRIACAIELLEDPEDAKLDLEPEIDSIKDSATKCHSTAKEITAKFAYWHLVIMHLKRCSFDKHSDIALDQAAVKKDKVKTQGDQTKWDENRKALEQKITDLEHKLEGAKQELGQAKDALDRIQREDPVLEPSYIEEYARADKYVPREAPPPRRRGIFASTWEFFAGESEAQRQSEEAARMAREEAQRKERERLIEADRARRQKRREDAEVRYKNAASQRASLEDAVRQAYDQLAQNRDRLAEARANLEKSKLQMQQLNAKELELKDIELILKESSDRLGELKEQIEPLVTFFQSILNGIDQGIAENAKNFLEPIKRRIKEATANPDEARLIELGRASKRKMLGAALQMQGHFSAIVDISAAYVTISSKYIRPAINRMERLSTCPEAEWRAKSNEFIADCLAWSHEIEEIAQETTREAPKNMKKHMDALQRRAIEAAQ